MDAKKVIKAQRAAQRELRKLVDREVTAIVRRRGPGTPVEEAFVRAVYSPDKRLG